MREFSSTNADGGARGHATDRPHAAARAAAAAAAEWIVVVYHSRNDRPPFVALSLSPPSPARSPFLVTHIAQQRWRAAAAAATAQPPRRSSASHPTRRITPLSPPPPPPPPPVAPRPRVRLLLQRQSVWFRVKRAIISPPPPTDGRGGQRCLRPNFQPPPPPPPPSLSRCTVRGRLRRRWCRLRAPMREFAQPGARLLRGGVKSQRRQ